jgi:hypothetical protein
MSKGTDLIAAERERQVTEEGYTAEHDAGHARELISAGRAYASHAEIAVVEGLDGPLWSATWARVNGWPWAGQHWKPTGDPVRDLVKAGALIAAAIDSLTGEGVRQSNLVEHARRELELLGEEPGTIAGYLKVIRAFADMGHSGGSAAVAIPVIHELLQFKNLRPLTDDPAEWEHIAEDVAGQPDLWQNLRNSEAFSKDGGRTYYLLSERVWSGPDDQRTLAEGPLHTSAKAGA